MEFQKIKVNRLIVHKIIGKKSNAEAYAIAADDLHKLDGETEETLKSRIIGAVAKSKRFFETRIEATSNGSFWEVGRNISQQKKVEFIKASAQIAQICADAHSNGVIPGGLLIIIDGQVDAYPALIVIKAELQEAMTLRGNSVELIKELFLSPAKEFYKIGFLIHRDGRSEKPAAYLSYVYDDTFNPRKDDIAEYFYRKFLGFSTSENDKLNTNNFLKQFVEFVDENIDDHESRKNIKIAIKADYRESGNKIVDPSSYAEFFEDDKALLAKYKDQILARYPRSFTKDLELVEPALQKTSLLITPDLKLVGPSEIVDTAHVLDPNLAANYRKLTTEIQSGTVDAVVVINSMAATKAPAKKSGRSR